MSVIAVYSVPRQGFLLGDALGQCDDVSVRLESVVPVSESFVPYLWVSGGNGEAVDALLADDTVAAVTTLDHTEEGTLVKIRWQGETDALLAGVAMSGGSLLDGTIEGGGWTLRLRFPARDTLAAFDRRCRRDGIEADLVGLHQQGTGSEESRLLTSMQHDTLRVALALGYFEVPRETTLAELATELDVSDSAVSQRLRRGTKRLAEAAVSADGEPRPEI